MTRPFANHAQESVFPKCLSFNSFFMYLLVVFIIPQSGVTTYAYADCHISFDCVCRQQFSPAGTCVLSRNTFSHVLLVPGYEQLSLWYLAKQIPQTRSTSLVRLLLRLLQGWILRLYSNQNFILGLVKLAERLSRKKVSFGAVATWCKNIYWLRHVYGYRYPGKWQYVTGWAVPGI